MTALGIIIFLCRVQMKYVVLLTKKSKKRNASLKEFGNGKYVMGNIQNRKREYESGLNSTSIEFLKCTGQLRPKEPHESLEDFVKRAAALAQHFQDLEENRKDPQLVKVKEYILGKGW